MNNKLSVIMGCLLLLFVISCQEKKKEKEQEASLDGIWESIGYGRLAHIKKDHITLYETSAISCYPIMEEEITGLGDELRIKDDTLELKDGINIYQFVRRDEFPQQCVAMDETKKQDALYNFEVLASIFKEHYAYFEMRNIKWDSLYTQTKSKITTQTSAPELFMIMEEMLDQFNDGHIDIEAPEEIEDQADSLREPSQPVDTSITRYSDFSAAKLVGDYYLKDKELTRNSRVMRWGKLNDSLGYLQINLMMGHVYFPKLDSVQGEDYWNAYFEAFEEMSSAAHTKKEVAGINKTLDQVFSDLNTADALVLDVRFNGGGKDEVALSIMKRFNQKRQHVFTKKAKHKQAYTKPNKIYLEAAEQAYLKPVYLLTSGQSASATEIMVLSSLNLPHVTRIGTNTEGIFSDVLDKILPNGWEIGLSNEVYLDTKENNYEGKGIPPHIDLKYPRETQAFFKSIIDAMSDDEIKINKAITDVREGKVSKHVVGR
ncbi:S41 family peptidase [Aquimarina sp. TRL1]|uniref:S41 family peptidase n=1 Tax=Aquimarina sp. (strain TRL1) TaxID=2736252 RepID=UPI00158BB565|nr:S41 family peptidase [Aquimarina sp. TRL1]QKX07127.1 S41 family peptidase [Aquimarina sp. TRL1]